MESDARAAGTRDVSRVASLLHTAHAERTLEAYERAVRARIAEEDGGTLVAGEATLSWALDGGALFLYDLVGEGDALRATVEFAERLANLRFAAVLAATLYDDDPMLERLRELGFQSDWTEPEAAGGRLRTLVGLVRAVA
ncbi:hypothetical protein EPN52_06500 [bacterium]|nr:MAG: hypothetical protein EPN52_06500 [bacterium]